MLFAHGFGTGLLPILIGVGITALIVLGLLGFGVYWLITHWWK